MNTIHLAHTTDPETSHTAARSISAKCQIQDAILELLEEEPRTVPELVTAYLNVRADNKWPELRDERAIDRRLSELHKAGEVIDTGDRGVSRFGKTAVVWGVA